MLAAQYVGNETIQVVETTPVEPGPGEVRIRVAYVGICGTDLHILHGSMDARVSRPAVIGHEMSGTVEAVGADVTGWTPGDAVTVLPLDADGTCPACRAGNSHICQNLNFIGVDSAGALQEYWTVPAETLVGIPAGVPLDHAALIEPVAVAVHDVRRAGIAGGEKVVVIGGGPIGVLIATVASRFGAEVTVLELDASRRELAQGLGLHAVDPRSDFDLDAWTGGAGADVVFEVSGAAAAVLSATDLAKVRGTVVIVAIHPEPRPVNLHRVFWRELTILGARVYERRDFETAVELIAAGDIPADKLITRIVPLPEVAAAFETLASGGAMKVLVDARA
jgi:(R,R)-butanediol dehydrogenase/meso-butanediol dehydrogenase/diacetyl reductase